MKWLRLGWLLARQVARGVALHPVLTIFNAASVALGVTVFLAIQGASESAMRGFDAGVDLVAGTADLEIKGELNDGLLPWLQTVEGVDAAAPMVEGTVILADRPSEFLRVCGVDPLTGEAMRIFTLREIGDEPLDLQRWLSDPEAVAISPELGKELGLKPGEGFDVIVNGTRKPLRWAFEFYSEAGADVVSARTVFMDVGWAQELFGRPGKLSSIQIKTIEERERDRVAERINRGLPPDREAASPGLRSERVRILTQSFRLNLLALSMVSLLVGMFFIYNSVSASVARRRAEIATLRAVGMDRGDVRLLFLGEAALAGVCGSLAGAWLAQPLAGFLVGEMVSTVTSLYVATSAGVVRLDPAQLALGIFAGTGAAILAAWAPADEAARLRPATVLREGSELERFRVREWHGPVLGILLIVASVAASWAALQPRGAWMGFVSAFCVMMAFALFAPSMVRCAAAFGKGVDAGPLWKLANDNLRRGSHRNSVTIAALGAALAMLVGIDVMIHSFRGSVREWIEGTLQADVFLAPMTNETAGLVSFLPENLVESLRTDERVAALGTFREIDAEMNGEPASLGVVDGDARSAYRFIGGDAEKALREFRNEGSAILVSESLARRLKLRTGESVRVATPSGFKSFRVVGVYVDYTRDQGLALIDRRNFDRFWDDDRVHSAAAYLREPSEAEAFARDFRERYGGGLTVLPNVELRSRIFSIFEQTFAVTNALRLIAIVVAVAGVAFSMTTLIVERVREIGVLRAIGASRSQTTSLISLECGLIGLLASILGIVSGCCLAVVLTLVINKAFFGWTIELAYPLVSILATPVWMVPVALLAGLIPGWFAARISPSEALRCE